MFQDPYCTTLEADTINVSVEWVALTDEEKEMALKWGRLFLDSKYTCLDDDGSEEYENALKLANALLGNYHVQSSLFNVKNPGNELITEKSVKAGSVSISKKFTSGNTTNMSQYDPYPDVTAALAPYCSLGAKSGLAFKTVIR